jgi:hypothetical protein
MWAEVLRTYVPNTSERPLYGIYGYVRTSPSLQTILSFGAAELLPGKNLPPSFAIPVRYWVFCYIPPLAWYPVPISLESSRNFPFTATSIMSHPPPPRRGATTYSKVVPIIKTAIVGLHTVETG